MPRLSLSHAIRYPTTIIVASKLSGLWSYVRTSLFDVVLTATRFGRWSSEATSAGVCISKNQSQSCWILAAGKRS